MNKKITTVLIVLISIFLIVGLMGIIFKNGGGNETPLPDNKPNENTAMIEEANRQKALEILTAKTQRSSEVFTFVNKRSDGKYVYSDNENSILTYAIDVETEYMEIINNSGPKGAGPRN